MNKIDPSVFFVLFIAFFLSAFLEMPFLLFAGIIYTIWKVKESKQNRDRSDRHERRDRSRNYRREYRQPPQSRQRPAARPVRPAARKRPAPPNPFKTSGVKKFKDFDYDGAIEDFKKSLEISEQDMAVHFNIACAYSLNEEKEKAFYHLSRAVELGMKDFEKIKTHDALAYIRIQDEFDAFVENNYRWPLTTQENISETSTTDSPPQTTTNPNLLEQLKQLGELREKGLLTEQEFEVQKRKLLG